VHPRQGIYGRTLHARPVTAEPEPTLVAGLVQRVAGGDAPEEEGL
jgi:hypothetical protein